MNTDDESSLPLSHIVFLLLIFLHYRFRVSSRGSPTQVEERKALPWLCTLKLIPLSFFQIVTVLLAMYTLTILEQFCDPTLVESGPCSMKNGVDLSVDQVTLEDLQGLCPKSTTELIAILAYTHIFELSVVAFITLCLFYGRIHQQQKKWYHWWTMTTQSWTIFPHRRRPQYRRSAAISDITSSSSSSWWHGFCRCCCACTSCCTCCMFGGAEVFRSTTSNESSLSDISIILADFFNAGSELDVTPSDVLVGISALKIEHRQKKEEKLKELRSEIENSVALHVSTSASIQCASRNVMKDNFYDTPVFATDIEQGSKSVLTIRPFATGSFDDAAINRSYDNIKNESIDDSENSDDDNNAIQDESALSTHSGNVVQDLQICRTDSNVYFKVTARRRLNFSDESDRQVIQEGCHYMRYALAVYGHVLYIAQNPCTAPCCLLAGFLTCRGGSCCEKGDTYDVDDPIQVIGDGILGCNQLGFLVSAGLHHADLVYASFKTGIKASPYVIAVDKERKTVVVAIKGTFSLESLVTDLNVRPEQMGLYSYLCDVFGEASMAKEYCHSGMLHCAVYLYKELERSKILDRLLLGENPKLPTYSLVITGHSLGAGCAAVLSMMLRNKFPSLRCFCFAPPGCVVSFPSAQDSNIISYVLDSDIVPRLSVHSVVGLRNDVLDMIARVNVPKHEVLSTRSTANTIFTHRRESIPLSPYYTQVLEFKEHQEKLKIERKIPDIKLYPPGRLVHLVENKAPVKSNLLRRATYIPVWAELNDFAEIQLTKSFLSNHDPAHYLQHLTSLQLEITMQR